MKLHSWNLHNQQHAHFFIYPRYSVINFAITAFLIIGITNSAPVAIANLTGGEQRLFPKADGTIVDGGIHGIFDGIPDDADWSFNRSGFEGAITLKTSPAPGLEHRVVWEYDLQQYAPGTIVSATLEFTIRGATYFPADPAVIQVVVYSADLLESESDFLAEPTKLVKTVSIAPYQALTDFVADVSLEVIEAIAAGSAGIGFRFQIDPDTTSTSSQAFMDILDVDLGSKPILTISSRIPGDTNNDGLVDLTDYYLLAGCLSGPGVRVTQMCRGADFDLDDDVDLADFRDFLSFSNLLAP